MPWALKSLDTSAGRALIQEGIDSGPSSRTWEEHRAELNARIAAARAAESHPR